jgi:hypothetical protein
MQNMYTYSALSRDWLSLDRFSRNFVFYILSTSKWAQTEFTLKSYIPESSKNICSPLVYYIVRKCKCKLITITITIEQTTQEE